MKPGSVVVDMAATSGGNVEGSVAGETVEVNSVKVIGNGNWSQYVAKAATDCTPITSTTLWMSSLTMKPKPLG